MTRLLPALLAFLLAVSSAFAGGAPVTLYDGAGVPLGTANNALYVTGGTGGASNSGGTAAAATTSNGTDGQATSATNQQNVVFPYVFNGTTWDRVRGTGGAVSTFLSTPLPAGTNAIGGVSQTGTWSVGLTPGTALVGKVGIDQTTPGTTNAVADFGTDGTTQRQLLTTTTGALEPPTAASASKIVTTVTSLPANTSTTIQAANANVVQEEIQCDGTAVVAVDRLGGTLTSTTGAGATAPLILPASPYQLYTFPMATRTAVTAYTATAQTCRVTVYLR